MKTCNKCHEQLSIENFKKHPTSGDGYMGLCKRCCRSNSTKKFSYYEQTLKNHPEQNIQHMDRKRCRFTKEENEKYQKTRMSFREKEANLKKYEKETGINVSAEQSKQKKINFFLNEINKRHKKRHVKGHYKRGSNIDK